MKKITFTLVLILFLPLLTSAQTYTETQFVGGLAQPVTMAFAPDGRIFVAEKAGRLRIVKNGTLLQNPFLTLNVAANSERGLLGVTFDPNFSTNRYMYVYYTRAEEPIKNRLSRFTASATNPDVVEPNSERILIDNIASDAGNHNGGAIHFGKDGKLYVAIGDGGRFTGSAQALNSYSGKILRINSDGTAPTDNPFYNEPGALKEIWAYGFRNPFTFAVDPVTGVMHVNDVGSNAWEEVNLLKKGKNYGWPICEGPYNQLTTCQNLDLEYPIHTYDRSGPGRSITGGVFYKGDYYFGDYVGNFIKKLSSTNVVSNFVTAQSPVDIDVGPDNNLYYLSIGTGRIFKLTPGATPVNGQCAVVVNTCSAGTFRDTADTATQSQWSCVGSNGGTTASCSLAISSNRAPVATITSPVVDTKYNAGQAITITGTGVDPEDGTLPASAFTWTIVFHHDDHTHPFLGPITGKTSDTFTIPTTGETSDDVWYRIYLKVTDSKGATHEVYRDIYPNKVNLTFETNPPGRSINLDGQPRTTPLTIQSVVGVIRQVSATAQTINGELNVFRSWSNGREQAHEITTPSTNTTYTATFERQRPANIVFQPSYGSGDIALHMQKEVDDRINGVTANDGAKSIWSTRGTDTRSWVRNTGSILTRGERPLNLTGQSPWNSSFNYLRSGTLISPRHVVFAKHYTLSKDMVLAFVDTNNTVHTRKVEKVEVSSTNDLGVALLDRDVPESIPFYPVIPRATWETYLKDIDRDTLIPIFILNQNDKVGVRVVRANQFYTGPVNMAHAKSDGKRGEFDEPLVSGDSGNPAFAVIGGQPVLLFTHLDQVRGPNLATLFNDVNAMMSRLGGGYQLSTVDLSRFAPAKPPTSTNRPPTAEALQIDVTGLVTTINFIGSDPDGDPLLFGTGIPPVRGTLRKITETQYTYTLDSLPNTPFVDGFNYYATDRKLPSEVKRVTLRYTPQQYNLIVTKTGQGTITATGINCGLDCAEKYTIGTNVSLTATAASGYTFTGWSGECTGMTCTVSMTKDRAVTANFAVVNTAPVAQNATYTFSGNSINITLTASDGQNDPLTFTPSISAQARGTLTKASNDVYTYTLKTPLPTTSFTETFTFTASDGKLTSAPATVTMQYTVAAPQKFNLTVSKTGNGTITGTGINCGNDCTESINAGSVVTLTATPTAGHNFTRWTGACTNTAGTCTVTMDRARTVNAVFTAVSDPDRDGDGILLPVDKCPNTPANLRNQVNRAGCVRPKLTKFSTKPVLEDDITAIQNVELGITNVGKITFKEPVTLTRENAVIDIDANVIIEQNKVEIKSAVVPELNKPATITLYNIDEKNPRILRNGEVCLEPQCKIESFVNGTLTFTVTGFSIYTVEETPTVTPVPEPERPRRRGGGGGGGGGGRTTTQTNEQLIAQLTAQLNALIAQLNALTGGTTPTAGVLTKTLSIGSRDPEVRILQQLLNKKGVTVPITGFYGAQTQAAVRKFQAQNRITQTGSVGPLTRGKLNQ